MRYGKDGKHIELTWPGTLPKPALLGDTATYAEVLSRVDLEMRAQVNGYAQRADAAESLGKTEFKLAAEGLIVTEKDGALTAKDDDGKVWFQSPPAQMWDSGTKSAEVGVKITDGTLELTPDHDLMAAADTTFPVTIDPDMVTPGKTGWTKVLSGKADTECSSSPR
ncbi:hypothetical protein AB0L53_24335 [Nonomuraea sp. NPDC052129]|uniref:hypothetical protein n=1 Tax=Nonomuraea sp. NPDC052129 TaxID=3154651 RepID=UPI003435B4FA